MTNRRSSSSTIPGTPAMESETTGQLAEDSIATRAASVLQRFSKVAKEPVVDENASTDAPDWTSLDDSLQRYRLWCGSQGALHPSADPRSLDHKLRYTPLIAKAIIELLEELESLLQHPSLNDDEPLSGQDHASPEMVFEEDDLAAELIDDVPDPGDESTWISDSIADLVGRLFKVSMLAQQSHARDRYARAEASSGPKFDEHFDIMHVTEYVKARNGAAQHSPWLLERLGKAITKRRNFILYCREHKERIAVPGPSSAARDMSATEAKQVFDSGPTGGISLPARTRTGLSRPSAVQTSATTLIPASGKDEIEIDDTDASTVASSVDFGQGMNALRVPDLMEFATLGMPFECPYCGKLQEFSNTKSWRRHVRSDIRPFLCTFKECGLLMFEERRTWEEHELQKHRLAWYCQICSGRQFASSVSLHGHLRDGHNMSFDDDQADTMLEAFSRPKEQVPAADCLICDWTPELKRQNQELENVETVTISASHFTKHLAGHLEQLALFALPRIVKHELGSNDAGGAGEEEASSRGMSDMSAFSGSTAQPAPPDGDSGIEKLETSFIQQVDKLQHELEAAETTSAWIERCERDLPDPDDEDDEKVSSALPTIENRGGSYVFPPDVDQTPLSEVDKADIIEENRNWERHCTTAAREGWDPWEHPPGWQQPKHETERFKMHEESGLPKREYLLQLAQRNAPREASERPEGDKPSTSVEQDDDWRLGLDDEPGFLHADSTSVVAEPPVSRRGSLSSLESHEMTFPDSFSDGGVMRNLTKGNLDRITVVSYESDSEPDASRPRLSQAVAREEGGDAASETIDTGTMPSDQEKETGDLHALNALPFADDVELDNSPTADPLEHVADLSYPENLIKTRLPKYRFRKEAIMDLGYPFEEEDDSFVLNFALKREQVDDLVNLSDTYTKEQERQIERDSSSKNTAEKIDDNYKKGKTRVPKAMVRREVIESLGCVFDDEDDDYYDLHVALSERQIDHMMKANERMTDSLARQDAEGIEEVPSNPMSEQSPAQEDVSEPISMQDEIDASHREHASEEEREDNPYAFTPGHLGKMYNPKSLAAFRALGGLSGIEKGLRTDRHSGLSVDERAVEGKVSFEEATTVGSPASGSTVGEQPEIPSGLVAWDH